jgi:hypothetical protein
MALQIIWVPRYGFAQSAWLSNHIIAKHIELLPNNTPVITEYPILNYFSGPGPHHFDSYTQLITGKGKHAVELRITHEATGRQYANHKYEIDTAYDGDSDGHLAHWVHTSKDSGWYRMEILCGPVGKMPELVTTTYFYQNAEKPDTSK